VNVAFYDCVQGEFYEHMVVPDATPDDVRQLVSMVQMEALQKGDNLKDVFLVAWDGKRKGYTSVFVLHDSDHSRLNETLLDAIKNEALKLSAKK
jgi:hypothetical protein